MTEATRVNGGKRKPPKTAGSNARERARAQAAEAARKRKRRNLGLLVLAIVVVVAAIGVGIGYATNFGEVKGNTASSTGWGPVSVTAGKPIVLGKPDAPVTVKLYEDFRCPHCQEFEQKFGDTLTGLQNNGTIKIDLWILPVIDAEDNTNESVQAGNAFACAAQEGFGQAMYEGFWKNPGQSWNSDSLIALANKVAKPPSSFKDCVTSMKHQDWVNASQQAASTDNVSGTPTMFINGKVQDLTTVMNWTPDQMKAQINNAKA